MWKKLLTIYLLFGLSLAIIIASSLYTFQRYNNFIHYGDAVDRNHALITELNELKVALTQAENYQRAFMLFNDSAFYHSYEDELEELRGKFRNVYHLLGKDSAQQRRLRDLNIAIKSQMEYLRSGMLVGYPVTDYRFEKGYMEKSLQLISELQVEEKVSLNNQVTIRKYYESNTPQNFRLIFFFTLGVFCVSFFMLVQQYRDRIKYQKKLEQNIIELNQANEEWEQIAYVASHDLQEPLRKIRTFSDLLQNKHFNELNDESKALVQKINSSSSRAQSLMMDMVNYTSIAYNHDVMQNINLNDILKKVIQEMKESLTLKNGSVQYGELPIIQGYASQLMLLFRCLIENSIKFSKTDQPLTISISSVIIKQKQLPFNHQVSFDEFYKIVFEDNGIGFDNQYTEKIFKMFQRLHTSENEFEGRGIGLAIVKRIVNNHLGFITARGRQGKGAKFTLYFPLR